MITRNHPGPLVVAAFTVYCDRAGHQITVVTDGTRIVSGTVLQGFRSAVTRRGTQFTIPCDVHDYRGAQCDGEVTVDQADPDAWQAATPQDCAWLDSDAQTVDVA